MSLAAAVGFAFLLVLFAFLAMVLWGMKRSIDLDLEAERRR